MTLAIPKLPMTTNLTKKMAVMKTAMSWEGQINTQGGRDTVQAILEAWTKTFTAPNCLGNFKHPRNYLAATRLLKELSELPPIAGNLTGVKVLSFREKPPAALTGGHSIHTTGGDGSGKSTSQRIPAAATCTSPSTPLEQLFATWDKLDMQLGSGKKSKKDVINEKTDSCLQHCSRYPDSTRSVISELNFRKSKAPYCGYTTVLANVQTSFNPRPIGTPPPQLALTVGKVVVDPYVATPQDDFDGVFPALVSTGDDWKGVLRTPGFSGTLANTKSAVWAEVLAHGKSDLPNYLTSAVGYQALSPHDNSACDADLRKLSPSKKPASSKSPTRLAAAPVIAPKLVPTPYDYNDGQAYVTFTDPVKPFSAVLGKGRGLETQMCFQAPSLMFVASTIDTNSQPHTLLVSNCENAVRVGPTAFRSFVGQSISAGTPTVRALVETESCVSVADESKPFTALVFPKIPTGNPTQAQASLEYQYAHLVAGFQDLKQNGSNVVHIQFNEGADDGRTPQQIAALQLMAARQVGLTVFFHDEFVENGEPGCNMRLMQEAVTLANTHAKAADLIQSISSSPRHHLLTVESVESLESLDTDRK